MFNYSLITAAGRGLRLMPLTRYILKAMVQINGNTLLSNLIKQLRPQVTNIFITAGYMGNDLAKHAMEEQVSAIYNTNNKDDGWWLFNTPMKFINEPVIVLACDLILDLDLEFIYNCYIEQGSPTCMLVPIMPVENAEGHYIHGDKGIVHRFSRTDRSGNFASGIFVINPCRVNAGIKQHRRNMEHPDQDWGTSLLLSL